MVIPSDRIDVELHGRRYGVESDELPANQRFTQDLPEVFRELAVQLRQQSKLLDLDAGLEPAKPAIFAAYAEDLTLLKRYLEEFEACVKNAIRCSIKGSPTSSIDVDDKVKKTWAELRKQIPPLGRAPLLELPASRAAKPAPQLLLELQTEFGFGVERVLRLMTYWMQLLVEQEFVGLVEWTDLDVAKYHYFRHDHTEQTLRDDSKTEHEFDPSQPIGEQNRERTTRRRVIRTSRFRERHVHHIVAAQLHRLLDYPQPVPPRIREFLESVPSWLRPKLQIVEGQITMEEQIRRQVGESVRVETEIISEYKYSPGVLLGYFNLLGWSATDLRQEGTSFFRGQTASGVARRQHRQRMLRESALWIIGVLAVISPVTFFIVKDGQNRERKRQAYVAEHSVLPVMTVAKGSPLVLPSGLRMPVYFAGRMQSSSGDFALAAMRESADSTSMALPGHYWFDLTNDQYGDVDLGPTFGLFFRLHVLGMTEKSLRYSVTAYGQPPRPTIHRP